MVEEIKIDIDEKQMLEINKLYVQNLKETLRLIDEIESKKGDTKDRLDYAFLMGELLTLLVYSIKGWQKWCKIDTIQSLFDLPEMEKLYKRFKEITKAFIILDIETTSLKVDELEKEISKYNENKKKSMYLT